MWKKIILACQANMHVGLIVYAEAEKDEVASGVYKESNKRVRVFF